MPTSRFPNSLLRSWVVSILQIMMGGTVLAQTAIFEFTGASTADNQFNAVTTAPVGGTISNLSRTNVSWVSGANIFSSSAWASGASIDTTEFLSFSVTPSVGQIGFVKSLSFDVSRSGTGPASAQVSLFGNTAAADLSSLTFNPTVLTPPAFAAVTFDFTDVISADPLTFRFYGWGSSAGAGTMRFDNVSLTGAGANFPSSSAAAALTADTVIYADSSSLTLSGGITGGFGISKLGSNTAKLTAPSSYTGTTTISAGNLQVGEAGVGTTGTGAVNLNGSTAVLSGTGTVSGTTTTVTSGVIKPGDNGGSSTGALTTQTLVFTPASTSTVAEFQIGGISSYDALHVLGSLTLSSSGNIKVDGTGYTPVLGHIFTLIDWVGALNLGGFSTGTNYRNGSADTGTNLDLPDISSSGYLWQISDLLSSNALTIAVAPEPGRVLLIIFGAAVMLTRHRRSH